MELFVTGTDTGVGKTFVTAGLAAAIAGMGHDVMVQKWVATGSSSQPEDLSFVKDAVFRATGRFPGNDRRITGDECPYCFAFPASPHLSARLEKRAVSPDVVKECYERMKERAGVLLIEGVGGLMVPLSDDVLLSDILSELGIPSIVVARAGLGTINHTLLTVGFMKTLGIPVRGVILNRQHAPADDDVEHDDIVADNRTTIERISGVPVLAVLPRSGDVMELAGFFREVAEKLV
jgi:dethiobiotin synthetase